MKKIISTLIVASAFFCTGANAFFFFFLPGNVTGAITDAVTGSEGTNCVGSNAIVGSTIRVPGGSPMVVKSLSGTSSRCTQPEFPIRAMLVAPEASNLAVLPVPSSTPIASVKAPIFTSTAGIDLPDGWAPMEMTSAIKEKGYFFMASNRTVNAGLLMSVSKRAGITDMLEFAKAKQIAQIVTLKDGVKSNIEKIQVNSMPAWRFEVSGVGVKGINNTYQITIIDSGAEIVIINAFMYTASYADHATQLGLLASNIKGLHPE